MAGGGRLAFRGERGSLLDFSNLWGLPASPVPTGVSPSPAPPCDDGNNGNVWFVTATLFFLERERAKEGPCSLGNMGGVGLCFFASGDLCDES